ncbi:two pore domain potassium channel family protein [Carboxylicivirga mesophila]|uniref:Two pore domain potassium channel family protein n=1 Tax=Carboxylicivirga mesophila TaxID=1166478 RepID=A0ABS5KEG8_9BACT|nr:two pore domain potassium channel family protein [Carboxylicivirga mesophila]MBS2213385.1 two pore domain potassium channel family protein [Carboxylicivirga mesophila]
MGLIGGFDTKQNFKQLMSNWGLLVLLVFTIFGLPIINVFFDIYLFGIFITFIVVISTYATSEDAKPKVIVQVLVAIIAVWITDLAEMKVIHYLSSIWLVVFFLLRVFKFIKQLSRKEEVNILVIIEAINGYLLIGVGFAILVDMISSEFTGAFNFMVDKSAHQVYDSFYYTFVSMTTLGYGDLLPVTPIAKSLALLITLCGQFYLVIIMALLVGRLLAGAEKN